MRLKELSGNALKVIAIVAMTIDHLAWVGIETYEQAEGTHLHNQAQRNDDLQAHRREEEDHRHLE